MLTAAAHPLSHFVLFHFFFVDSTIMFALLLFQFWFLTFCTYFYFALLIFNFSTSHLLCTYFSTKLVNFRFWHNVGGSSFVSLSESFRVFLFFPKLKRIKHEKLNKSPQEDYLGDPILSGDCVRCRMKFFGDLNIQMRSSSCP